MDLFHYVLKMNRVLCLFLMLLLYTVAFEEKKQLDYKSTTFGLDLKDYTKVPPLMMKNSEHMKMSGSYLQQKYHVPYFNASTCAMTLMLFIIVFYAEIVLSRSLFYKNHLDKGRSILNDLKQFHDIPEQIVTIQPSSLKRYFNQRLDNPGNPRRVDTFMNYEWARYQTYKTFPQSSPARPIRLASAGFFYTGSQDRVKCFSCGLEVSNWKEIDIPAEVHRRLSPHCLFMTDASTENIPINNTNETVSNQLLFETDGSDSNNQRGTNVYRNEFTRQVEGARSRERTHTHYDSSIITQQMNQHIDDRAQIQVAGASCREAEYSDTSIIEQRKDQYSNDQRRRPVEGAISRETRGENITSLIADFKGMGIEYKRVETVISNLKTRGLQVTSENIASYLFDGGNDHIGDDRLEPVSMTVADSILRNNTDKTSSSVVDDDILQEENDRLIQRMACKICLDTNCNVVFMPCGHVVSCDKCAAKLKKCAVCRIPIQGRVKTNWM